MYTPYVSAKLHLSVPAGDIFQTADRIHSIIWKAVIPAPVENFSTGATIYWGPPESARRKFENVSGPKFPK